MKTLSNENVYLEYRSDRSEIFGRDKTDQNNDPAFYTKTKRGVKKAWAEINGSFTENTTMYDTEKICHEFNIRTHYWCMVD